MRNELKREIYKNSGINEEVDFSEEDVLKKKREIDSFAERINELERELSEILRNAADYRTDRGDFLIKGFDQYVRAAQYLGQALMNIRKGASKGLGKMPTGKPGTFYSDREEI